MEVFKTIDGFEDYEISNCGRVKTKERKIRYEHAVTKKEHFRSTTERYLKTYNNVNGYKFVILYKNKKSSTKPIHRLVALNFLDKGDFNVVNHKDGNKHNNTVENLEWCTDAYNHQHATETGLLAKGEKVASSVLDEKSVYAIKYLLNFGISQSEISKAFKVSRTTITHIATNRTWKHIQLAGTELTLKQ